MTGFLIWCFAIGLPVLVWFMFRQGGYKREALDVAPGPDWVKTEERFVDPASGETLDVWFHPESGERAYVRTRSAARDGS
jgi:hypothetical protein